MKNLFDDAWRKLETAPHPQFDPVLFKWGKLSNRGGLLLELDKIYSSMYHLWPTLQKDVNDITEAVSLLDWSVAPFVRDGRLPDKKAQQVAETVSRALWQVLPQEPGTYGRSFLDLVGAVVHALYRGQNVHQIIWARTPDLVYPAEYRQLLPQYYMWETRSGERDRLLLVPDGSGYGNAVPFAPYHYIVALNTLGPDHPLYNGVFYSLAGYFGAAAYGLPWLQDYCLRYGHPVRKFSVQNAADEAKLREELQKYPDVTDVFLRPGRTLEITPIPAGAGIPHETLLRLAENMCHQCILGQTLTSDASSHGGSRAQAQVHAGVQAEVVLKRAEFVCRILNRQLVPAIVYMNYGRVEGLPMPELKCSVPNEGLNLERIQAVKEFLSIPGAKVAKSFVHEFTRIPMPGDGDEVYGAPDAVGDMPAAEGVRVKAAKAGAGGSGADARGAAAEASAQRAWQQWAKPAADALEGWLDAGMGPAQIQGRLQEAAPDTDALAQAFSAALGDGMGINAEAVAAANPYGCNQFGEGWCEPHNGNSTAYRRMAPFDGGAPPRKVITSQVDGNKEEVVTDKKHVGKGDYPDASNKGLGKEAQKAKEAGKPKGEPKDAGGQAKGKFAPATTKAEAQRVTAGMLKDKGNLKLVKWRGNVSLGQMNEYNEALSELMERFPGPEFSCLGSKVLRGKKADGTGAFFLYYKNANTGKMTRGGLYANADHDRGGIHGLGGWKPYSDEKKKSSGGFARHNVGATADGISLKNLIAHEYGHALHMTADKKSPGYYNAFVADAFHKAKGNGDIKKISEYAAKNAKEFVAECFTARLLGEHLPGYVDNMLDKIIRDARMEA